MADCHVEEKGMPSEGKGQETSPAGGVVCGGFEERIFQSGQTTGRAGGKAGEVDRSA